MIGIGFKNFEVLSK